MELTRSVVFRASSRLMKNHTLGTLAFLAIAAVIAANIVPNFLRAQFRRDFMGCRSRMAWWIGLKTST